MKDQAIQSFQNRQAIVNSLDNLIRYGQAFQKNKNKVTTQLSLFDIGLEDKTEKPKIELKDNIDLIEWYKLESQLLGVPITYDPLKELWMYEELYCTHKPDDVLKMTEYQKDIVIMDIINEIEHRKSKSGNDYVKIYTQNLGETYLYLTGKAYQNLIFNVFKNQIYLFDLTYNPPTKDYSKDSININYLKNINDIDIDNEYNALMKRIIPNIDEYKQLFSNMWIKSNNDEIYFNVYKK